MPRESLLILLADATLVLHAAFTGFVVVGLMAVFLGFFLHWRWVRHRTFRLCHAAAIAVVVAQSWAGIICPLTTLEMALREAAGANAYAGSFIQHWLQRLLYFNAPAWVFVLLYTGFGGLVLASWFLVRPRRRGYDHSNDAHRGGD